MIKAKATLYSKANAPFAQAFVLDFLVSASEKNPKVFDYRVTIAYYNY